MPERDVQSVPPFPDLSSYRGSDRARGSAVAHTTRALREAIFDGVLAPGQWLREESLAYSLDISRTPLREALNRLEEEGLIARERGLGARVTSLTSEDMIIVYQVRGSLESLATSIAAQSATKEQIQHLIDMNDRMVETAEAGDSALFNELNIDFHRAIASTVANVYLKRLLGTVETAIRRFGTRSYTVERMREITEEHHSITAAIAARDREAASAAAVAHAERAREATLQRLLSA